MIFKKKVLWTVFMRNEAEESRLFDHAIKSGATGVAIRTSNRRLLASISRFHEKGIEVYGWRWPNRKQGSSIPNLYAIDQANYVAEKLIPAGMDGYYADIESDGNGALNDWNDASLRALATEFCGIIRDAAPRNFFFGLTSGCRQPTSRPNIPWASFQPFVEAILPQTYWRWKNPSTGKIQGINGGSPASAISFGKTSWRSRYPSKALIPMAGEIQHVTESEIHEYGRLLKAEGVAEVHSYTDNSNVSGTVLRALKNL